MIEQSGTVTEVRDGAARINGIAAASCGSCSVTGGCGTSALAQFFARRARDIWVRDHLGVRLGDRVVIGLEERALQHASVVAYVWPLLGLLAGAVLGDVLTAGAEAELGAIALGLIGLSTGLLVARRQASRMAIEGRYQAHLIRILGPVVRPAVTLDVVKEQVPE